MVAGGAVGGAGVAMLAGEALDGGRGWAWSRTDVGLELAFLSLATLDLMQTSWFRARGDAESNPLLGAYPSQREVVLGVGACMLGHVLVSAALPKPWRHAWQGAGIGVELGAVLWNRSLGVGLRVPL
jgi:hypothetical protein